MRECENSSRPAARDEMAYSLFMQAHVRNEYTSKCA